MILTNENYFSSEASKEYISVSQYKAFVGSMGRRSCEAKAMAELKGIWKHEKSDSLLVGSYVDSYFENTLDEFKAQNPEIFTMKGELKSQYKQANEIIGRIERDPLMMKYLSGQKQIILTAELFGTPWKIKIDSYHPNVAIVDLKVMKSLNESFYVPDFQGRVNFIEYWGYDLQLAVYQRIEQTSKGREIPLPVYIVGATKEKEPNIEVIGFDQLRLNQVLSEIEYKIPRILALKNEEIEPDRCETCDYCRFTKILTKPVHYSLLTEVFI